jgi:hypothetical protein
MTTIVTVTFTIGLFKLSYMLSSVLFFTAALNTFLKYVVNKCDHLDSTCFVNIDAKSIINTFKYTCLWIDSQTAEL